MDFLSALLFFVSLLFGPCVAYGQTDEGPVIAEEAPQSCVKIPKGKKVVECSCNLTPPPEFREPDRESCGSFVRTSYLRMMAVGVGSNNDLAERDAKETCIAAVREALIGGGMSAAEVNRYPLSSHILFCRSYVCNKK